MRLAGAAEKALQQGRPSETVEKIRGQLTAALIALREGAASLLEGQVEPTSDAPSSAATADCARDDITEIRELQALFESQDLAAIVRFGALTDALRELLDEVHLDELRRAVDDLDFPRAARLLRDAVAGAPAARAP
jgi:hypothetical protein